MMNDALPALLHGFFHHWLVLVAADEGATMAEWSGARPRMAGGGEWRGCRPERWQRSEAFVMSFLRRGQIYQSDLLFHLTNSVGA